jgi:guanylate kinase
MIFNKSIDHWFNWMLKIHDFKYYLSEPTLCYQGSEKNPTLFTNSITTTNNKRYNHINGPKLYFITFSHNIAIQASKMNLFEHVFYFTESSGTSKSSIFKQINNIVNENDILFYCDVNNEMEMEMSNIIKNIRKLQTIKNGILTFSSKQKDLILEEIVYFRKCNQSTQIINNL